MPMEQKKKPNTKKNVEKMSVEELKKEVLQARHLSTTIDSLQDELLDLKEQMKINDKNRQKEIEDKVANALEKKDETVKKLGENHKKEVDSLRTQIANKEKNVNYLLNLYQDLIDEQTSYLKAQEGTTDLAVRLHEKRVAHLRNMISPQSQQAQNNK